MSTLAEQLPDELRLPIQNGRRVDWPEFVTALSVREIRGEVSGLPDDLAAEVREHAAGVADFQDQRRKLCQRKSATVKQYVESFQPESVAEESAATIFTVAADVRAEAFRLVERAIRLNREAIPLVPRVEQARRDWIADAREELDVVKEQVAEALTAAGQGIESQPSWTGQPNVASLKQFDSAILKNTRVAPKVEAIGTMQGIVQPLGKDQSLFMRALEASLNVLNAMAEQVISD